MFDLGHRNSYPPLGEKLTIRFVAGMTAWLAVLFALLGLTYSADVWLFVSMRIVAWSLFTVFCAYSLTRCLVSEPKSAFWIGVAVFSITALVATMLADAFFEDSPGCVVSDLVFFSVPDIDNAEPIDKVRLIHARGVFDLILATGMAVCGGLAGRYHGARS